jgi:hypothetical protein
MRCLNGKRDSAAGAKEEARRFTWIIREQQKTILSSQAERSGVEGSAVAR